MELHGTVSVYRVVKLNTEDYAGCQVWVKDNFVI